MEHDEIKIAGYLPKYQPSFEKIFLDWFESNFKMKPEPIDKFVLSQPEKAILNRGGAILMALSNEEFAGAVALKKIEPGKYELTKMIVDEKFRSQGIGRALCVAIIKKAKAMGAQQLVLY